MPIFIISMTTACCLKSLLLHSSNLLTVARMEVKLGAHEYYITSMTTTTTNSLRHFSLKLLLHSLTIARMEVKLGMCAHYIISKAITRFHVIDRIMFEKASAILFNPLDAMGISLDKQKLMYKVLAPSIMTPYKFLWTYGGSGHNYVSVAG